jgi:hypothetical protein
MLNTWTIAMLLDIRQLRSKGYLVMCLSIKGMLRDIKAAVSQP